MLCVDAERGQEQEIDSGIWTNRAFELARQMFTGTDEQFEKRLEKLSKVSRCIWTCNFVTIIST